MTFVKKILTFVKKNPDKNIVTEILTKNSRLENFIIVSVIINGQ